MRREEDPGPAGKAGREIRWPCHLAEGTPKYPSPNNCSCSCIAAGCAATITAKPEPPSRPARQFGSDVQGGTALSSKPCGQSSCGGRSFLLQVCCRQKIRLEGSGLLLRAPGYILISNVTKKQTGWPITWVLLHCVKKSICRLSMMLLYRCRHRW